MTNTELEGVALSNGYVCRKEPNGRQLPHGSSEKDSSLDLRRPPSCSVMHLLNKQMTRTRVHYYNCLLQQINRTPRHGVLVIMGDFKANVGSDNEGYEECKEYRTNAGEYDTDDQHREGVAHSNGHVCRKEPNGRQIKTQRLKRTLFNQD